MGKVLTFLMVTALSGGNALDEPQLLVFPCHDREGGAPDGSLTAFAPEPALNVVESPVTPSISSIEDRGNVNGERQFRIHGLFPDATASCAGSDGVTRYPDVACYRVTAFCKGRAIQPGRILGKVSTFLDVAISERPSGFVAGSGSRCQFVVAIQGGGTAAVERDLSPPPVEIHGVVDRGMFAGAHYFELYGWFLTGWTHEARVTCDGTVMPAGISTPNPGTIPQQINIWFTDPNTASKSCVFKIRRVNDNVASPPWYQRVNGPRSALRSIGAYYWGGFEPDWANRRDAPQIAVRRLHDAGIAGPIRFTLTPDQRHASPPNDSYDDFSESGAHVESQPGERCAGLSGVEPAVPSKYLPTAVCTTRFLNALAEMPSTSTVILTTLDQASAGPDGGFYDYLSLPWMTFEAPDGTRPNFNSVRDEYKDLAAALFHSQAGTNKTFIISNWEADSMLYGACGGPAVVADAIRNCTTHPPACVPQACSGYPDKMLALREWFKARQAGIDAARTAAGNPVGPVILDAIEFSQYRIAHGQGLVQPNCPVSADGIPEEGCLRNADALHGIIPWVRPRVALYSAWESTGLGRVDQDLREIALYLYSVSPGTRFGLGEFGVPGQAKVSTPFFQWLFRENVSAARRSMVLTSAPGGGTPLEHAVIWQAYPTVDAEEGLLTVEGAETHAMRRLREGVLAFGQGSPSSRILGVREVPEVPVALASSTCHDLQPRAGSQRYFELYGIFPGGGSSIVRKRCSNGTPVDDWTPATTIGTPSTTQINIQIPNQAGDVWCVFSVSGAGQTTPDFGPIRSPKDGACNPIPL